MWKVREIMMDFRIQAFGVAVAGWWLAMAIPGLAAGEANLSRGKQVYEKYCLACHGPQGRGDGATQFDPPVADLTSSEVLLKPDSRLLRSIHDGRTNTVMDAWKTTLPDEAIRDVLAYILTFPR
jgi:cytochrome c oxidase cbb3-type subunit 3